MGPPVRTGSNAGCSRCWPPSTAVAAKDPCTPFDQLIPAPSGPRMLSSAFLWNGACRPHRLREEGAVRGKCRAVGARRPRRRDRPRLSSSASNGTRRGRCGQPHRRQGLRMWATTEVSWPPSIDPSGKCRGGRCWSSPTIEKYGLPAASAPVPSQPSLAAPWPRERMLVAKRIEKQHIMARRKKRNSKSPSPGPHAPQPSAARSTRRAPQTLEEEDALRLRIVERIRAIRCRHPERCGHVACRRNKRCVRRPVPPP